MTRKKTVADAFAAAAATYETAAEAQTRAADRLTELVRGLKLPPSPTVLEVGCGTGLLTRRLLPALGGDWLVTDISPAMVEAARTAVPAPNARFRAMDAENPDTPAGLCDLVVSNLAAQWFGDLGRAVNRLLACLAPGGTLAFSTLGRGSFVEWRQAHERLTLACGTPVYPSAADLAALLPANARVLSEPVVVRYPDAHAFVDALKRIGAGTPAPGHRPLPPGALRRVIRAMGAPVAITYDILYVLATAD